MIEPYPIEDLIEEGRSTELVVMADEVDKNAAQMYIFEPIQEAINSDVRLPFRYGKGRPHIALTNGYPDALLGGIHRPENVRVGSNTKEYPLRRISRAHGRAAVDRVITGKLTWGDDHGILFSAYDIKGYRLPKDFNKLPFFFDPVNFFWRLEGCQPATGLERRQNISEMMRREGLPTEAQSMVWKVKEVPYNGNPVTIQTAMREYIADLIGSGKYTLMVMRAYTDYCDSCKARGEEPTETTDSIETELFSFLKELAEDGLYIIERSLPVAERMADLKSAKDARQLLLRLAPAFRYLRHVKHHDAPGFIEIPDFVKKESISLDEALQFLTDWWPRQFGVYLARFHNAGFVHGFAHAQNLSTVGSLYDLDSVFSQSDELGNGILEEKCIKDFGNVLTELEIVLCEILKDIYKYDYGDSLAAAEEATETFKCTYLAHRVWPNGQQLKMDEDFFLRSLAYQNLDPIGVFLAKEKWIHYYRSRVEQIRVDRRPFKNGLGR